MFSGGRERVALGKNRLNGRLSFYVTFHPQEIFASRGPLEKLIFTDD